FEASPSPTYSQLRFVVGVAPRGARLASGCSPGSTGWDCLPTGFLRKVLKVQSLPLLLLSQAFLAQYRFIFSADRREKMKRHRFSMQNALLPSSLIPPDGSGGEQEDRQGDEAAHINKKHGYSFNV